MHKTFTIALSIVAVIGWSSNAFAGGSLPVVTHVASRPGQPPLTSLSTENRGPMVARDESEDAGLVKIANNFTKYANSPYWGWFGYAVFGPARGAGNGTEWWMAAPFTPKSSHLATRVEVAAEYDAGTNAIVLGLYDDAGGVPGKQLHSWQLANLPHAVCCTVVGGSDNRGIPLTGGKQYWVALRTNAKDSDAVVIWALTEFADVQKNGANFALFCSGSCQGWKNNAWNPSSLPYGFAFSVLGK